MSAPPQHCPFCRTELSARAAVCKGCQARRQVRTGMSPSGFRWFFGLWVALSVPLLVLAFWVALVPWLPRGEPPGYALALIGAKAGDSAPRCRVEVTDASGRATQRFVDGDCGSQPNAAAAPAASRGPSPTTLRMAAAVHSLLTLAGALLACFGLLRLLRRPFLQRATPSWVRRAAA